MDRSAEEAAKMAEKLQGNGRVSKYANPITCLADLNGKETNDYVSDHNSFTVRLPNGCPVVTYNLCVPGSPGKSWEAAPYLDEDIYVVNYRIEKGLLKDRFKQQIQDIQEYAAENPSAIFCFQEFKFEIQGSRLEIPTDFLKGSLENWSAYKMVIKDARNKDYAFGNLVLFNPEVWGHKSSLEMKGNLDSSSEGLRHQAICLEYRDTGEDWTFLNGHNKWDCMKLKSYTNPVSFYKDFLNSPGNRFIAGDLYLDHMKQASDLSDLCVVHASVDGARGEFFDSDYRTSDYIFVKKGAQGQRSSDLHKDFYLHKDFFTKKGTLINASRNVDLPSHPSRLASQSKIQLEGYFKRPNRRYPLQLAANLLIPLDVKLNPDQKRELFGKLKAPLGLGDHENNLLQVFSNRLTACGHYNMDEKRELADQWMDEIEKHIDIQWAS